MSADGYHRGELADVDNFNQIGDVL